MTQKNTSRGMLLNVEVLNLSVKMIKDLLGLDSAPNAEYSDEMVEDMEQKIEEALKNVVLN